MFRRSVPLFVPGVSLIVLVVGFMLSIATRVHAQDKPSQEREFVLDEVVVSATRLADAMQELRDAGALLFRMNQSRNWDAQLVADYQAVLDWAHQVGSSRITVTDDPRQAVKNADVLNTDVWASMGQEAEAKERERAFAGYCLDDALVALAKPDCIVMHCLPAHRGEEITDSVIEGPRSVVWDEAENRLHVQKAIMASLMK